MSGPFWIPLFGKQWESQPLHDLIASLFRLCWIILLVIIIASVI